MEQEIMMQIENVFKDEACQKCCEILKKLKDSILRFRKYFEGESL